MVSYQYVFGDYLDALDENLLFKLNKTLNKIIKLRTRNFKTGVFKYLVTRALLVFFYLSVTL